MQANGIYMSSQLLLKLSALYTKEFQRGLLTFGATEKFDLTQSTGLASQTSLSYVRGKYGIGVRTKREMPGYGPPEKLYASLLWKLSRTSVVLRASTRPIAGGFSVPELKVVVHSHLGDNFVCKSEYNYPKSASQSYFGYAFSKDLHFGIALQKLSDGSRRGFLERPFNLGFSVNYHNN